MAVLTVPVGAKFTKRAWVPPSRTQVNRSGWTGARKALRLPGAGLWRVSAAVRTMTREIEVYPWRAFLLALEGQANTFLMPVCEGQHVVPGTGEAPVVVQDGTAVQGSTTMRIAGLGAGGLRMFGGQYMSVVLPSGQTQLLGLTQDLLVTEGGVGVARFRGALRETLVNGARVEISNPVCEMEMASGDVGWDEDEGQWTVAFDAVEAFNGTT